MTAFTMKERSTVLNSLKEDEQMDAYRDYDKFQKCARCELKPWCRGCPAVASGATGDFYAPDPQCWKTKNDITGEVL